MINPQHQNINYKQIAIISMVILIITSTQIWAEEKSLPTDGVSNISIKSSNNIIKILPWYEAKMTIRVSPETENPDNAIANISKMERKDSEIVIEMDDSGGFIQSYEVFVPEEMNIHVAAKSGSIYITGIKGKKRIEAFSGNVELRDVVGSVSAKTVNGNIFADIRFDAESDFASVSGSIEIQPKDAFSVPINIGTASGSIKVTLPSGYATDLEASTISGQIISELPDGVTHSGRSLRGKLFGGGPSLKIGSISGAISIKAIKGEEPSITEDMTSKSPHKRKATEIIKPKQMDTINLPVIEAIKILNPPVIDGRLDEDSWKKARKIDNFVWADGIGSPHQPTETYMLWDDKNLYIGVRCYDSNMVGIKIANTEKDSNNMWNDDNVQFMIDSTPETKSHYYHIAINPIGTIYDQEVDDVRGRSMKQTKLGIEWSFGGSVDTDIRDNFWTIEIAFPFESFAGMKPNTDDLWRINIHRVQQQRKEYTYWSPTYSTPEWPHIPDRFGELVFSDMATPMETHKKMPKSPESTLAIVNIIIEGNDKISEEEIIDSLGLTSGDLANVDTLSSAKLRLASLGWFQNIGMELIQNEKGVDLVVRIKEKDIITPAATVIEGMTVFTKRELTDYFNLTPYMTTMQDVATKCELINGLYKTKGYEMATAECSMLSNALQIDIDEGQIDEIEIHGNDKIKTRDIIDSLNIKPGMAYKRNDIDSAVNLMKHKLPYFHSVNWRPRKSDDGSNVVYIEVKESSLVKTDFDSMAEFNRVHGLQLGLKPGIVSPYWGSKAYFGFSYGFSSDIWNYQFGGEKSFFRNNKTTIGADIHKMTDTNDWEIISDTENFIAEVILGEAFRDYYQREGFEVSISQELPFTIKLGVKYRDDEYKSLPKTNDWSVLNRFYDEESDRNIKHKRGNPQIIEGRMKSVIGEAVYGTRNNETFITSGWYNRLSIEYGGERLGGDYDFTIYQAEIRNYGRISRNQLLGIRVKAATTDRELPRLHPKKFYLGGIGTLRGYSYKEFEGDTIFLMNAEYWLSAGGAVGVFLFADSGYAWKYGAEMTASDLKTDVGIGFGFGFMPGGFTVAIATPIEEDEREPVVSFRLSRTF